MAGKRKFSAAMLAQRLIFSFLLVYATYNPSGYSIAHWLLGHDDSPLPAKLSALLGTVIVFYAVSRIVFGAFRRSGILVAALLAVLASLEPVEHLIGVDPSSSVLGFWIFGQYVALTALALVMAFGLSWSSLIERLTGQLQKRYVQ